MKPDERELLKTIARKTAADSRRDDYEKAPTVREIIDQSAMPDKRAHRLLEKWSRKGWYDYGVTLDLGWLTELGKATAKNL